MNRFESDCDAIKRAREVLASAKRVLIGAGSGLSTAAGHQYSGERFQRLFAPFIERYGMTDLYSAGFYPFPTEEDRWAFWAHYASVECASDEALPLYRELFEWARTRDYFVITTNVDLQFEKVGFDPQRIFATQGDYAHIQCVTGEHGVRSGEKIFAAIECDTNNGQRTRVTDAALVPTCDVCGRPMTMHLRCDDSFVQTDEWYAAEKRYRQFVEKIPAERTVLLELGVGWNTPVWIRMPFDRLARTTGSLLVRMNYDDASTDPALPNAVSLQGDIAKLWPEIAE